MRFQTRLLSALALSTLSQATKIYVSSYSGNITIVTVAPKEGEKGNLTLTAISSTDGCAPNPSWLELDQKTSTLYCADEGFPNPTNATFSSFGTGGGAGNGSLVRFNKITTLNGGVYSKIYGNGSVLALANYGGSGITIIDISKQQGSLDIVQEITFTFQTPIYKPGTNDTINPYIHQTIIDPTKTFLLAPDLSADLIHVFSISPSYTLQRLSTQVDLSVKRGHGARHGVFYQPGHGSNKTYLYVVMETANMVHGYEVFYNANKTLSFNELQDLQLPVPSTAAAAEIRLTPDNKYLIVSSRNDTSFTIPHPDPQNTTHIPSDSMFTFLISPSSGQLSQVQRFPAGGLLPRQFEINKAGTMLAVALNGDNRVVVIGRDVASGNLTGILGSLEIDVEGKGPGMVTCAVWDEDHGHQSGWAGRNSSAASPSKTGWPSHTAFSSATGAPVSTPTPFQPGMIGNCSKFHLVAESDTCSSIATAAGIALSDFYAWNPAVGSSCATMLAKNNVCVGVGAGARG